MTPMELLIAALIVWWTLRRLLVDSAAAIRGHAPPRWNGTAARGGRGGSRRYGARGYMADLWSDAWQDARARRVAKREAGAATGGSQAGTSRWSRLRQAVGARWEAAWGRWEARQNNRRGRGQSQAPPGDDPRTGPSAGRPETGQPGKGQSGPQQTPKAGDPDNPAGGTGPRTTGASSRPDPQQPTAGRRPAGGDNQDQNQDGGRGKPGTDSKDPTRVLDARRIGNRWVTESDHGRGTKAGPNPNRQRPGRDNQPPTTGGKPMAEATGLTTSIAYAADMSKANEANVAEAEGWAASLQAQGVSGPAVEAAHRAMEAQQQAAEAWRQAKGALDAHLGVKEQYDAHPDAGSREFVTSE